MILKTLLAKFPSYVNEKKIELYNEFSLQHELGIFLRNELKEYVVQFERNISFFRINKKLIKKEIDIVIYKKDMSEKYAIELKYPRNGQYPEQMYSFVKDIIFMEQLKTEGFDATFSMVLVDDKLFYEGKISSEIYDCFRGEKVISGIYHKPTGKQKEIVEVQGSYLVEWKNFDRNKKYYIIETR